MVCLMKNLHRWKRGPVWNSKFQLSLHPCCPFSTFSLGVHRVLHTIVTVRLKRNVSSVQNFAMITSRGQKGLGSRAMWLAIDASSEKQINWEQISFSCNNTFSFLKNCWRNSSSHLMLPFFLLVFENYSPSWRFQEFMFAMQENISGWNGQKIWSMEFYLNLYLLK